MPGCTGCGRAFADRVPMVFGIVPWEARAFCASLLFYHLSEFCIALRYNPTTVSHASWLFSRTYVAAMGFAVCEYVLLFWMFPDGKNCGWCERVKFFGLALCVAGDGLRKVAQIKAAASFTHVIQTTKRTQHKLIKHGVYHHVRHPGYLGWLVWSVGTQVLLCNPCSVVLFALAALSFFRKRIPFEETALRRMFPGEYAAYAAGTKTWIPGVP